MSDTEEQIREILHHRLQLARQPDHQVWDDEAVAAILAATAGAREPSGMVPATAAGLVSLKERAEGVEALAAEMLASFTKGPNGWSARVKAAQVEQWQEKLGGQP